MNNTLLDFNAIRADRAALVRELEAAGATFKGNVCKCPFHGDEHASAGIYADDGGAWRFKCQTPACGFGGDVLDVRAKLAGSSRTAEINALRDRETPGANPSQPKRPARVHPSMDALKAAAQASDPEGGNVARVYEYTNPDTRRADMLIYRIERPDGSKTFRQAHPIDGGFVLKAPPGPWPLYNRARIREAMEIIVAEGEKAVHALHAAAVTATTAPGGAGKARLADWTPLAGKSVFLWPDADHEDSKTGKRAGIEHMHAVARELAKLDPAPLVFWIDPDRLDLPPKGDAHEFVQEHGDAAPEAVREIMRQATRYEPPPDAGKPEALAELDATLAAAVKGTRYAVPLPWPGISNLTRALLPGTVTVLCGSPGATKSLALIQALRGFQAQQVRAAALMLEDGAGYHLRRALAQIARDSSATDDDWCRANPTRLELYRTAATTELAALQKCVEALSDEQQPTAETLLAWVEARAADGCRVIAVDPITLMVHGPRSWQDDERFLFGAKRACEKHGASLLLVSHPRRMPPGHARKSTSMDDLAGGIAYSRFSQTVLYLVAHESRSVTIRTPLGCDTVDTNRTLIVFKARNGRGVEGRSIAMQFDGASLTLHELGEMA